MRASEIMRLAVSMARFDSAPADSFVFNDPGPAKRAFFGIDAGPDELRAAAGRGFDLVIAHHPPFRGAIAAVLGRHADLMTRAGVPPARARRAFEELAAELVLRDAPFTVAEGFRECSNLASSIGVGYMNVHLPCDELGKFALQEAADKAGPCATLEQVARSLDSIPELEASPEKVRIAVGDPGEPAGKVVVVHAAGTNGGEPVARALFEHGAGTVVYIHVLQSHEQAIAASGLGNLIVTGHHGSDSIGINALVRELRMRGLHVETGNGVVEPQPA